MRFRRKDAWDDDWDDDEVKKPRKPQKPRGQSVLTTKRIFWGLVVVAIVALVASNFATRQQFQLEEIPQPLIGAWACGDPARSDHWVEFRRESFLENKDTSGGVGSVRYRILGVDREETGGIDRYKIYYRDLAGTEHTKEVRLTPSGASLRFTNDPATEWSRFDQ